MTQTEMIKEYMRQNNGITSLDAVRLGCLRLAARIADLEKSGVKIRRERVTHNHKTFTRYHLEED